MMPIVFALALSVQSQVVLRGTVRDQSGLPVPHALVYLDGTQTSVETDAAGRFTRIHRSAIVNAERIKELRPQGSRRHSVTLADGTCLILSRSRADRLKHWFSSY